MGRPIDVRRPMPPPRRRRHPLLRVLLWTMLAVVTAFTVLVVVSTVALAVVGVDAARSTADPVSPPGTTSSADAAGPAWAPSAAPAPDTSDTSGSSGRTTPTQRSGGDDEDSPSSSATTSTPTASGRTATAAGASCRRSSYIPQQSSITLSDDSGNQMTFQGDTHGTERTVHVSGGGVSGEYPVPSSFAGGQIKVIYRTGFRMVTGLDGTSQQTQKVFPILEVCGPWTGSLP